MNQEQILNSPSEAPQMVSIVEYPSGMRGKVGLSPRAPERGKGGKVSV
jgi:hypothetical protein